MGITIEVYGKHLVATQHKAQDRFLVREFEYNGQKIYIGVLADGCTEDVNDINYHPRIGAKWLVEEFVRQSEALYQQGFRGKDLGRAIALAVLAGMRDYQPQYSRSKWIKGQNGQYCDELVATLYGFVADDENLLVVTCGDGYIIHNGQLDEIEQSGIYPTQILASVPEKEWPDKLETIFIIQSVDIHKISAFGIASDGLSYLDQKGVLSVLARKGKNPRNCVNTLFRLPISSEKHDDITIVYMTVR